MTVTESTINHLYQSGMGISINNHETLSSDIQCKYKKQYQSLYKAIAGKKISRNSIKVDSGRPPTKNLINNIIDEKGLLMVSGIHDYHPYDATLGRGSSRGYEYQHQHIYLYGAHHYLPLILLPNTLNRIEGYMCRHIKHNGKLKRLIDIKPVFDYVTPSNLYEYLLTPYRRPTETNWINYITDQTYPLSYIYQEN